MSFSQINFVLVCNILLLDEFFKILWICVPHSFFAGLKSYKPPLHSWYRGLGLLLYPMKELMFQQLNPYLDYYPPCLLSFDPLLVLMLCRLLYIPPRPPPSLLNDDWNGGLLIPKICSHIFQSLIISSGWFINKTHPPPPHISFQL